MPSLDIYKSIHSVRTSGEAKKIDSDRIMNETWWEDPSSRVAYLYDYYHDDEPLKLRDLHPEKSDVKQCIDIKFIQNASQTFEKDTVTTHLQLRPKQKCNVDYYKEVFEDRYGAIWPIGLYVDIEDESGQYNRWLIVEKANYHNVIQFPTFEILPCDKILQYIIDGKKYQVPGVLRSQNSYNSGIWTDFKISTVEDQQKIALPLNRDTEKLYYNQRIIIDTGVLTEPRAWKISKVNRISPNGIARITFAQDLFDEHKDYIETDENGNVIGMWANYYSTVVNPSDYDPTPEEPTTIYASITYSGTKAQIKVGGSYKKFIVKFFDGETEIEPLVGDWHFTIDGEDASSIISISDTGLEQNQIKIKAPTDDEYIGKILTIEYIADGVTASLDIDIVAL